MINKKKKKYSRVYVEITNVCNKSCSFCPGTKRAPHFMNSAELDTVLSKLSGFTDYVYFHLMGEPTLHPDLIEFIRMAKKRGFHPMLTTNGSLLSELGKQIISAGVYKVNISLHSFEDDDEKGQIEYLKSCVDFAKLAGERGVIVTLRLWNGGTDADNRRTLEFLRESFGGEWIPNNRGERLSDRIFLEYADRFIWPDIEAEELGSSVYCHALSDHFGILADGSIVPCCLDRDGVMTLGNIFTDDLSKVLTGSRCEKILLGFQNRNVTEELCRRCPYARRF